MYLFLSRFLADVRYLQAAVAFVAGLVYLTAVPNSWAIDDAMVIQDNRFTRRGLAGIDSLLQTDALYGIYGQDIQAVAGGRWRPLTPVMFALEASLFGKTQTDANRQPVRDQAGREVIDMDPNGALPRIMHLINVILYSVLSVLIFKFILLIFTIKDSINFANNRWIALIASLLFAVHPLHTEAVANIKGRDEIMALMGAVLAATWLLRGWQRQQAGQTSLGWVAGACGAWLLGLMAKESVIPFLAVIPLIFWCFTPARLPQIARWTAPLLLVFGLFWGVRAGVLNHPFAPPAGAQEMLNDPFLVLNPALPLEPFTQASPIQRIKNIEFPFFQKIPYQDQLATTIYTLGLYLKLFLAPIDLTCDYYPRHIAIMGWKDWQVWLALLANGGLLGWAIWGIRRRSTAAFGILSYFLLLSIVSNVFFPIGTNMAERFMFAPSLGLCIAIAAWLAPLLTHAQSSYFAKNAALAVLAAAVLAWGGRTAWRNRDWKDNLTLFAHDIRQSAGSAKLQMDLGTAQLKEIQQLSQRVSAQAGLLPAEQEAALQQADAEAMALLEAARPHLEEALRIHPAYADAWYSYGYAWYLQAGLSHAGPLQKIPLLSTALMAYEEAIRLRGEHPMYRLGAANCYRELGKLMGQTLHNPDAAIAMLSKAAGLSPEDADIHVLLGVAYAEKGMFSEAIASTEKSLSIRPHFREATENLAAACQLLAAQTNDLALLKRAETLLLEVVDQNGKIPDTHPEKERMEIRTYDLLQKNYGLQKNSQQQAAYRTKILKINPKAFDAAQ